MRKRIVAALGLPATLVAATVALFGGGTASAPAAAPSRAPAIGASEAREIGLVRAAAAGDPQPTVAVESDTGAEAATAMAAPQGAPLAEPEGGVYVVDMHGQFTLGQAHMPRGAKAPSGTVLKVAIAHDGFVLGIHLGNS